MKPELEPEFFPVRDALVRLVEAANERSPDGEAWLSTRAQGPEAWAVRHGHNHPRVVAVFDGPAFTDQYDLSATFQVGVKGWKDTFYRKDGSWAFPYRSEGDAVQAFISRPLPSDPDGYVEILAMLEAEELPAGNARAQALADYIGSAVAFFDANRELIFASREWRS